MTSPSQDQASQAPKVEDNPAIVEPALTKVRKYFETGKTRTL